MGKIKKSALQELVDQKVVGGSLSELATYADLFLRSQDLILLLDPLSLQILESNPAWQSLAAENSIGQSILDWVPEAERELAKRELFRAVGSKRADTIFDLQIHVQGTKRIFEVLAGPLKLQDYAEVLQIIARDVTEMRLARRELEAVNRKLSALSVTDEMTGLCNYRGFMDELAREHAKAQRKEQNYSLIFCDVDHFKKYNDQNGHPAGDQVLKQVAQILQKTVRENIDLAARYGGEEFVVLCANTDLAAAMEAAERIRGAIASANFLHGSKQPLGRVSVSMGVATYPQHGKSFSEILSAADAALYASKEAGRNRVSAAQGAAQAISDKKKNRSA